MGSAEKKIQTYSKSNFRDYFFINDTGIQWRNLDDKFLPSEAVFCRSDVPSFYSVKVTWYLEKNT